MHEMSHARQHQPPISCGRGIISQTNRNGENFRLVSVKLLAILRPAREPDDMPSGLPGILFLLDDVYAAFVQKECMVSENLDEFRCCRV